MSDSMKEKVTIRGSCPLPKDNNKKSHIPRFAPECLAVWNSTH